MSTLKSRFKDWVNAEVAKELDKERFSSLPIRMRIGIIILSFSFVVGYGYPIALFIISGTRNQLSAGLFKGSLAYGICWILGFIGLTLAGKECIKYPIYFFAKLLKILFPNFFQSDRHH